MSGSVKDRLRAGVVTRSAEETRSLAAEFARSISGDATLALRVDLGAGKTTFVQGLANGFEIAEPVTSPTFTVFSIHRGPARTLVHFDAYRLSGASQIGSLMLEDFLTSPYCLAIEWPERVAAWLPADVRHLELSANPDESHSIRLLS